MFKLKIVYIWFIIVFINNDYVDMAWQYLQ